MKIKTLSAIVLSVFYISAFANANPGQHPMPPKESLDACSGKAKMDACSFTGPRGMSHEGNCFQMQSGELACVPKAPKVALDACSGKKEGDTCSFTGMQNNAVEGSCIKTPHGDVACRPSKMPEHPAEEKSGK